MNKMNAIVLHKVGGVDNFYLDSIPIPSPKNGEVRIRIKAAGFNPVDFKIRQGKYGKYTDKILGSDCSGIIDQIGEGVDLFGIGDEVYALLFGQGSNGTYAQYVCVPYQFVAKKPKYLSFEEAACVPTACLTAYRAVLFLDTSTKDLPVFIGGAAGGVGCFAVQLLQHFHNDLIYTIAGSLDKAVFLTEKLNIRKENILLYPGFTEKELKKELIRLNKGNSFFVTFDFVGKKIKEVCFELSSDSGRLISIVSEDTKDESFFSSNQRQSFQDNLSVHNIFLGAEAYFGTPETWQIYQDHLNHISDLFNKGKIKVPFYDVVGPLEVETVRNAHSFLETGRVKGKLVMSVDELK